MIKKISYSLLLLFAILGLMTPVNGGVHFSPSTLFSPSDSIRIAGTYITKANQLFDEGQFQESLKWSQKATTLYLNTLGETDSLSIDAYNLQGRIYGEIGEWELGFQMASKALDLGLKHIEPSNLTTALSYLLIGNYYRDQQDCNQALDYLNKALNIRIKYLGEDHPEVAKIYHNIGSAWKDKGDSNQAMAYYDLAVQKITQYPEIDYVALATVYSNMGNAVSDRGDYDRALEYYERAIKTITQVYGERHSKMTGWYNNIGLIWWEKGEIDKALQAFKKDLAITTQLLGEDHYILAVIYSNIAGVYFSDLRDHDQGLAYLKKSLALYKKTLGENHPNVADVYTIIGDLWQDKGDLKQSLEAYDQAARTLRYDHNRPYDFSKVTSLLNLRDLLEDYVNYYAYQFDPSKETMLIEKLQPLYRASMALEDHLQQEYNLQSTRQYHASEAITTFEGAITSLTLRNDPVEFSEAFQIAERTKSRFLTEKVQQDAYNIRFGLPDSLRQKEQTLNGAIADYEKKKFDAEFDAPISDDSLVNEYKNEILKLRRSKDQLMETFKTSFPDYYNLRYNKNALNIADVQQALLHSDQALLEYFVSEDRALFTFAITPDTFDIQEYALDFPLEEWVRQLRCGIFAAQLQDDSECGALEKAAADSLYVDAAQKIYQKIFAPVEEILSGSQQLIIIPDGVLGYIPFDALIKKAADGAGQFHLHEYLINDFQISYAYSATLLRQMKERQHLQAPRQHFIAYAPLFENTRPQQDTSLLAYTRNETGPLKYNIPEVEAIQAQIGGTIYTAEKATREAFLHSASAARILHLSTHGKANDKIGDYSFLAFYQQADSSKSSSRLYNRELYNLRLNADMVVLSACETGIGELQRGEGIISMARGFSYAGAKSIITTLWNVDDAGSNKLMTAFYRFLKAGKSKDSALKSAKLELMSNPQYASPYYWAAVIPIGDMSPVDLQKKTGWKWMVWIGGGLLFIFLFRFWKTRS